MPDGCESAVIVADAEALAEVLEQLLDNSLRYSEGPAQLSCNYTESMEPLVCAGETKVLASQLNTGQVFERFVRLEEHRDFNQADGSGLRQRSVRPVQAIEQH